MTKDTSNAEAKFKDWALTTRDQLDFYEIRLAAFEAGLAAQPQPTVAPDAVAWTDSQLWTIYHEASMWRENVAVNGPNEHGIKESRAKFVAVLAATLPTAPPAQPPIAGEPVAIERGGLRMVDCSICGGRGFYGIPGQRCQFCSGSGKVGTLAAPQPAQTGAAEVRRIWVVIDHEGLPEHATIHPIMAQDHINDALQEHDIPEAATWVVREFREVPNV